MRNSQAQIKHFITRSSTICYAGPTGPAATFRLGCSAARTAELEIEENRLATGRLGVSLGLGERRHSFGWAALHEMRSVFRPDPGLVKFCCKCELVGAARCNPHYVRHRYGDISRTYPTCHGSPNDKHAGSTIGMPSEGSAAGHFVTRARHTCERGCVRQGARCTEAVPLH